MFFSQKAIFILGLAVSVDAIPLHEHNLLDKRVPAAQKPLADLVPKTDYKEVALEDRHQSVPYKSGTDLAQWSTQKVPDVMAKWSEGERKMHGPYLSRLGKIDLATSWAPNDKVIKVEGKHDALKAYSLEELESIFLANHNIDYLSYKSKLFVDQRTKVKPDYTMTDYKGSLLQHMVAELGSKDYPDRMALLSDTTNQAKGRVWSLVDFKVKSMEDAYDLARTNNYMIAERNAFCATLDGIYTVLNRFHDALKPVEDTELDKQTRLFNELTFGGPETPEKHLKQNKDNEVYGGKDKKKGKGGAPAAGASDKGKGTTGKGTAPTAGGSDKDKDKKVKPEKKKDTNRGPLLTPFSNKQVYDFDIEFVAFMKSEILKAKTKMEENMKNILLTLSKGSSTPDPALEPLRNFKATFAKELLTCKSLVDNRRSPAKKEATAQTSQINPQTPAKNKGPPAVPGAPQKPPNPPAAGAGKKSSKPPKVRRAINAVKMAVQKMTRSIRTDGITTPNN